MLDTLVPRLVPGLRRKEREDGSAVLLDPRTGKHLQIASDQAGLLALLDGQRSVGAIASEHFSRHGFVPFQALGDLLGALRARRMLENGEADLDAAGIPPPHAARWQSLAALQLMRARLPGARAASIVLLCLVGAALLVTAGLAPMRDPFWALRLHLDPLRPGGSALVGLLGALAGISLALTVRSSVRAGIAALWGEPAGAWELRLRYLVPALELEDGPVHLLRRGRRMIVHGAALLSSWGFSLFLLTFFPASGFAAAMALGAAAVGFVDACPFAPTSLGQLLAALAGRVDLRDHARSYLSRRFLARLGARDFFEGEKVILATSTLGALWSMAGLELLARFGPRTLFGLYATARLSTGIEAAAGWIGLVVVGVAIVAGLLLMGQMMLSALTSVLPASMRGRASKGDRSRVVDGADALAQLRQVPLFAALAEQTLREIAAETERVVYPRGAVIVRQGDPGDRFFAILEGQALIERIHDSGLAQPLAIRGPGDCFGETALLSPVPRTATVRALGPLTALTLSREGFERLLKARPNLDLASLIHASAALNKSRFFSAVAAHGVSALLPKLSPRKVDAGHDVFHRGDSGDFFYLVEDGEVQVLDEAGEKPVATLGPGGHFGEVALLRDVPRTATVRATRPTTLWSLSKNDLYGLLARDLAFSRAIEEEARLRMKGGR
jgi:CRP-like cAMP-binding protein